MTATTGCCQILMMNTATVFCGLGHCFGDGRNCDGEGSWTTSTAVRSARDDLQKKHVQPQERKPRFIEKAKVFQHRRKQGSFTGQEALERGRLRLMPAQMGPDYVTQSSAIWFS